MKKLYAALLMGGIMIQSVMHADIPQKGYKKDLDKKISIYRPANSKWEYVLATAISLVGGSFIIGGMMMPNANEFEKISFSLAGAVVMGLGGSYFKHLHEQEKLKEQSIVTLDQNGFWYEAKGQYTWDEIKKVKIQTTTWTDQNGYTHRKIFLEIYTKTGMFDIYPSEIRISVYELKNFIKKYKQKYSTKKQKTKQE